MEGPLKDVLVLDLSFFLAGPFAGHILADLGARVIKIEPPQTGDPSRRGQGLARGALPNSQFLAIQRKKQSLTLDLKHPQGRDLLYDLIRRADVLLENYRPGVSDRLGIDFDAVHAHNPRVVYASLTGFGHTGPMAAKPAFDFILQAMAGAMSLTGGADGPPRLMGVYMGDLGAACLIVHAILAALYQRERSGTGCYIDVSMLDSLLYLAPSQTQEALLAADGLRSQRQTGPLAGSGRMLETSDARHVVVHCPYPKFKEALRDLVSDVDGFDDLRQDVRFANTTALAEHMELLWEIAERVFRTRNRDHWLSLMDAVGIPCAPVNTVDEALQSEQLAHRGMIVSQEIPAVGRIRTLGSPFNFSSIPKEPMSPAPVLGQDTDSILSELLDYSAEEIDVLKHSGVLGGAAIPSRS
jgi:crotonobetainyl-CoA:carnitine CoA-transferase CaiB-like acyl-CoA transferase